jgi:hypothetical protein
MKALGYSVGKKYILQFFAPTVTRGPVMQNYLAVRIAAGNSRITNELAKTDRSPRLAAQYALA